MAKKGKRSKKSRPKRTRGQKTVLHLTELIPLIFLLERMGLLGSMFWSAVYRGSVTDMLAAISGALKDNFTTSTGLPVTIAGGITVAMITALLRYSSKGSVSLKKPKAIAV